MRDRTVLPKNSSRRDFLRTSLLAGTGAALVSSAAGESRASEEPALIVRNSRPIDVETPVEVFDRFQTPNRLFFVRSHFGAPAVGLTRTWTLSIGGGVKTSRTFTIADLNALESVKIPAVLQCAGNGRSLFSPTIPGVGWEKGAVGNAEWSGVRLGDLLRTVGIEPRMSHVHLHGADGPPAPKTPAYLRSLPLDRAMHSSTIICTHMNGERLPVLHGGPLRLVVPGWAGNHWIKWLRSIVVAKDEAPGFYMQTGYKIPIRQYPPGVDPKPSDLRPVTQLNIKSLIAHPSVGATLDRGRVEVRGVAWTGGDATVAKVEVSVAKPGALDSWASAAFDAPAVPYAWRLWRFGFDGSQGPIAIKSRATDSTGNAQPEVTPWNKSGYLWNGYDHVACEVR